MQRSSNGLKSLSIRRSCCASRRSLHSSSSLCSKPSGIAGDPSYTPGVVQDVAVLGGGVTGLATAYYLTKEFPRARITIYEASDRLGGWISSKRVPVKDGNVLFEAGPRTLRPMGNGILSGMLVRRNSPPLLVRERF